MFTDHGETWQNISTFGRNQNPQQYVSLSIGSREGHRPCSILFIFP